MAGNTPPVIRAMSCLVRVLGHVSRSTLPVDNAACVVKGVPVLGGRVTFPLSLNTLGGYTARLVLRSTF